MERIPGVHGSVLDSLVEGDVEALAKHGGNPWIFPTHPPETKGDFISDLVKILHFRKLGISTKETLFFFQRIGVLLLACEERWETAQFDEYRYWDFFRADDLSYKYGAYLVSGVTRNIVAAKANVASLQTIGKTFIRLIHHTYLNHLDAVLDGPTNEAMIHPWTNYLESNGVKLYAESTVTAINMDGDVVGSITINEEDEVTADHYVSAMPMERFRALVTPELASAAPSVSQLDRLSVQWMNGILFYLYEDMDIIKGHVGYFDSEWALTSVCQPQFWPWYDVSERGDGTVHGILSVDISDWEAPGSPDGPAGGKAAEDCTKEEVIAETWWQLQKHLPEFLPEKMEGFVHSVFMDPDIIFGGPNGERTNQNEEPLLVNYIGTWDARPKPALEIPNLYIASDFAQTDTDVACMEAAVEASKIACGALLENDGRENDIFYGEIPWPQKGFQRARRDDKKRYDEGKMPRGWDFPPPSMDLDSDSEELTAYVLDVINYLNKVSDGLGERVLAGVVKFHATPEEAAALENLVTSEGHAYWSGAELGDSMV